MTPDQFLREYGADQYEVTIKPADAVRAADHAATLRELVYCVAAQHELDASFTPLRRAGAVGNGVHIHISFIDDAGAPARPGLRQGVARDEGASRRGGHIPRFGLGPAEQGHEAVVQCRLPQGLGQEGGKPDQGLEHDATPARCRGVSGAGTRAPAAPMRSAASGCSSRRSGRPA